MFSQIKYMFEVSGPHGREDEDKLPSGILCPVFW
jgi:hypothetical protein